MGDIFFTVLYQPLYNLLVFLYDLMPWGGLGLSIIIMTAIVRGVTIPLGYKAMKSQKELQEIQPKINEIREKYKGDQAKMSTELMAVYKTHNVNPFAACLPTIVQLVIFVALSNVLRAGIITVDAANLYPFVANPGAMSHMFLFMDLSVVSIPLAILAAIAQFVQARQMVSARPPQPARTSASMDEDMTATMNKMTVTMLPIMMLVMGIFFIPGGTMLYILVSTLISYLMYAFFLGKKKEEKPATENVIDVEAK